MDITSWCRRQHLQCRHHRTLELSVSWLINNVSLITQSIDSFERSSIKNVRMNTKKMQIDNQAIMRISNEVQLLMLYAAHLLPKGYYHTKNEILAVNILDVIERTRIRLQTDGETRQTDRQTDKTDGRTRRSQYMPPSGEWERIWLKYANGHLSNRHWDSIRWPVTLLPYQYHYGKFKKI